MGTLRIPLHEVYEDWNIISSYTQFSIDVNEFNNLIAKDCILKFERGGFCLLHPLTREHIISKIKDIITLLNKVKGNPHAFHWENQMYSFIQTIMGEDKFIDCVDIIATRLQEELYQVFKISSFYMSSYLFYILDFVENGRVYLTQTRIKSC